MDIKTKTRYLKMALNLQSVALDKKMAHRIVLTYDCLLVKKEKFSVEDITDIEDKVDKIYKTEEQIKK